MKPFCLYPREQLLSEVPVCAFRRWKNDKSAHWSDPLQSVRVETLSLTLS